LTKLPNRLYLHSRLPRVLKKVAQGDRLLALIYLDLDHFKNINDSRGHGCGDQLLQVVAQRLRAAVGAHDLVARMGGDEFVVVASLLADAEAVTQLAALLRATIQAPVMLEGEPLTVTASLGVAVYPRDALDVETLLKYADIALYNAKEAGRDCYRLFAADMDVKVSEAVALEQALRHAIGTAQIYMEYQPVIEMRTGRVASLEALMRWRHPELGLIPPSQFVPIAEKSGLIVQLGQQALQHVLARLRGWIDANVPIVPVAVNVSPLQFERTDFAAVVAQLAADASVEPRWLRFEITESAVMKEPEKLIGTLETLRLLGSEVLIDDFGTGFSSLSYLSKLPVDTLKIDRSFVHDLGRETARKSIINAVVDMAKRLNLKTIAEGVETAEQVAALLELGCEFGQGYFYSKPVTARHCRALLEELRRERPLTETMLVRTVSSDSTISVSGSSIMRAAIPLVQGASKARN
jgi:diguanylate cyclase (GGDEF)-like protein